MDSVKEIQDAIAEAEAKIEALKAAKADKEKEAVAQAADAVLVHCVERGFELADVLRELGAEIKQPKRAVSEDKKPRNRSVWVDALGRFYRGGKPPTWMNEEMAAAGIATTKEFCSARMSLVQ